MDSSKIIELHFGRPRTASAAAAAAAGPQLEQEKKVQSCTESEAKRRHWRRRPKRPRPAARGLPHAPLAPGENCTALEFLRAAGIIWLHFAAPAGACPEARQLPQLEELSKYWASSGLSLALSLSLWRLKNAPLKNRCPLVCVFFSLSLARARASQSAERRR